MNVSLSDPVEPLGVVVGALLVLGGLATLLGTPWAYKPGVVVMVGQIVGALAAIGIGVGLAWLVTTQK